MSRAPDQPRVRLASAGDVPALAALAEAAYRIYVPRMRQKPAPMLADYADLVDRGCVRALEFQGRLIGLLVMMPRPDGRPDHLFIENVAVDPGSQGRGYGAILLRHASAAARTAGLSRLRLYTNALMHENLAFYRRLGFVVEDRRREAGYDRIYMRKELTGDSERAAC